MQTTKDEIVWTRIFHNGKLVGAVDGRFDLTRDEYRAGYETSVGVWHKRADGSLRFDCGNTLDCQDINCRVWH